MPTYANMYPVPEATIRKLQTVLSGVTVANGYRTDVHQVLRFRMAGHEIGGNCAIVLIGTKYSFKHIVGQPDRYDVTMRIEAELYLPIEPEDDVETKHLDAMMDISYAINSNYQLATAGANLVRSTKIESWELAVVSGDTDTVSRFVVLVQFQAACLDFSRPF